jgi:hypothetical protein
MNDYKNIYDKVTEAYSNNIDFINFISNKSEELKFNDLELEKVNKVLLDQIEKVKAVQISLLKDLSLIEKELKLK